jgi:hypothetical protein
MSVPARSLSAFLAPCALQSARLLVAYANHRQERSTISLVVLGYYNGRGTTPVVLLLGLQISFSLKPSQPLRSPRANCFYEIKHKR